MAKSTGFRIKRIYDSPARGDGKRYLVDRLWPRGVKKTDAHLDGWCKEVAPSDGLRRWFGHDPARWEEFQRRYLAELEERDEAWRELLEGGRKGIVTLLYAARDTEHNEAVVLQSFLERKASGG